MANTNHKPAKGKPVTSHPLFPAVAALWFGALFGLGSLAIRPSLIEELVATSGIDLIVPAAAPPLGVTARILIALTLSALGALIGALLAWRINRPWVKQRERSHGPGSAGHDAPDLRSRDTHPDAPARRPISAYDELGDRLDAPIARIGFLAGASRDIGVDSEEQLFQSHDPALLPGDDGQALDITAIQLQPVDSAIPPLVPQAAFAAPLGQAAPAVAAPAATAVASPTVELTSPASLGMIDLAVRLQESMTRRRAARNDETMTLSTTPLAGFDVPDVLPPSGHEPLDDDGQEPTGDETDGEAFASLLAIGPAAPRGALARIKEPAPATATAEPVVIFPGQLAPGSEPFAAPASELEARQPVAIAKTPVDATVTDFAAPPIDPAEAEQALRAALANLQRMSGAA